MNRTALHDWHVAHSGRMVDFAGWEMPIQYSSIVEEHQAVRRHAGLFDIAHMGRVRFSGPDACPLLDRLLTNDVTRLKPGQVRYSLVCNEQGGILDDVLVYGFEASYLLVVNASNREKILAWIDRHRGSLDVDVADETPGTFMLALQGPAALRLLDGHSDHDLAGMKYYTTVETLTAGVPSTVSRTGYTGEDGFEVIVAAEAGLSLWETLIAENDPPQTCGLGCRDTLRLEAAMPLYGHELSESIDPLTAGLSFGVKLQAGDFLGKEALLRIRQESPTRRRIGLQLDGRRIAREGASIVHNDQTVGTVTSGTFSPTLEKSIAMGYVPTQLSTPQTPLFVDVRGQQIPAVVVTLPFYVRSGS